MLDMLADLCYTVSMTNTKAYRPYIPWPSDLADELAVEHRARSAAPAPILPARRIFTPSRLPTPIIALDVDGPCNPFHMGLKQLRRSGFRSIAWRDDISYRAGSTWVPYSKLYLSARMGEALAAFSRRFDVELVWGSMWEHNANTVVAPAMGLPRLPWVDFHGHPSRAWKWEAMAEYAAGRPLAWLDDSFSHKARSRGMSGFDTSRRNLPTLLHEVSPARGLRPSDLEVVGSWVTTARLAW